MPALCYAKWGQNVPAMLHSLTKVIIHIIGCCCRPPWQSSSPTEPPKQCNRSGGRLPNEPRNCAINSLVGQINICLRQAGLHSALAAALPQIGPCLSLEPPPLDVASFPRGLDNAADPAMLEVRLLGTTAKTASSAGDYKTQCMVLLKDFKSAATQELPGCCHCVGEVPKRPHTRTQQMPWLPPVRGRRVAW